MTRHAGWETIHPEFRGLIERVCTQKQIDVLKLRALHRYGYKRIGQILGCDPATARGHFDAAVLNIKKEAGSLRGIFDW